MLWAEGSCPPGLLALSRLLPIHRDVLESPLGQSELCGAASEQVLRVFQTAPFLAASVSASVFRGSFLLPMFPCRGLAFCTIVFADSLLSDSLGTFMGVRGSAGVWPCSCHYAWAIFPGDVPSQDWGSP